MKLPRLTRLIDFLEPLPHISEQYQGLILYTTLSNVPLFQVHRAARESQCSAVGWHPIVDAPVGPVWELLLRSLWHPQV